jgi:hypothetical protein
MLKILFDFFPLRRTSEYMLVVYGLLPLAGVVFWEWRVFDLMLVYWLENLFTGIFNVLKLAAVGLHQRDELALPVIPFFIFHYSVFLFAHLAGIYSFFDTHSIGGDQAPELVAPLWLVVVLAGMLYNHAYSFFKDYLFGKETDRMTVKTQAQQPYARVIVLHIALLGGGLCAEALGSKAVFLLIFLCLLKIPVEIVAARRSYDS